MDKNIRELIELNGAIIIAVENGTTTIKIYQATSHTKYTESESVSIEPLENPYSKGHHRVQYASDIIEFKRETGSLVSEKEYYLKETFIWLFEKALPYLAKVAKEQGSEIIITNTFDQETGEFESFASLSDDLPALFVSITPIP
jgi:hypothetical protein